MDKTSIETGSGPEEKSQNTPSRTLAELEAIIKDVVDGLPKYQAMGLALEEIRSRKLYKEAKYRSFGSYLEEHWKISRAHGYRLIAAARVAKMSPIGGKKPGNEHQARKRGSPRASKKTTLLTDDSSWLFDGIVTNTEAELEAFKRQMVRWQKFLSIEDEFRFLEKLKGIIDDRLAALDPQKQEEVAA